jgi:endonuclease/exonuclease/phosphatase family metal-dependent hydrolase
MDVIVLNEVFIEERDVLLTLLRKVWPFVTQPLTHWDRLESSGVFILSKGPFTTEKTMVYREANWPDVLAAKGVVYVHTSVSYIDLHVFATHLQASYAGDQAAYARTRQKQLHTFRTFVDAQQIPSDQLVCFCGDFNVAYDSPEYYTLTRLLETRPLPLGLERCSLNSRNDFLPQQCTLLDYVLVSARHRDPVMTSFTTWNGFKALPYTACINTNRPRTCISTLTDLSDHYPVVADITIL